MLALVPVENYHVRYGATFLVTTGILSGVTLSLGNITSNCCGDIKKAVATGLVSSPANLSRSKDPFVGLSETLSRLACISRITVLGHHSYGYSDRCLLTSSQYQSFGSTMGIATGYLFASKDAPHFTKGFWTLFAATCFTGIGSAFMTVYTVMENRRRDKKYGKPPTDIIIDFDEEGLMERHPHWRYYR